MTGRRTSDSRTDDLRRAIIDIVDTSNLKPGDQIPTETELGNSLGVSRPTIREALKLLEQDGMLVSRRGSGRFLTSTPSIEGSLTELQSVTELLSGLGYKATNKVLSVSVEIGTEKQTQELALKPDHPVVRVERARYSDDHLLLYSVDYFSRDLVPGSVTDVDWSESLFEVLASFGVEVKFATAQISASHLPSEVADRLGVAADDPWLVLRQIHSSHNGKPLLTSVDFHAHKLMRFQVVRRR